MPYLREITKGKLPDPKCSGVHFLKYKPAGKFASVSRANEEDKKGIIYREIPKPSGASMGVT